MSIIDYVVLLATLLGIAAIGVWHSRGQHGLAGYLRGEGKVGWGTIGLSVMATQASAITFLSTPGQAFESGMGFVQNYFGMPLALVFIAVVFLPIYRRLNVYTAYEYLGRRFDGKTRLLGAGLFLLQRGLAAGITIYAPAIILSTVLGWRLDATILATGVLVIYYTVSGGSAAVSVTQKYQMAVIFIGMFIAFAVLLAKLPAELSVVDATVLAGTMGKLEAVNFSLDFSERYTVWSGVLGGFFLSLSYFGTDQSQVQRYLSGTSLRESRLGLMFNALLKIPMQAFILFLGVMVFVFYQFERPPVFFNQPTWDRLAAGERGDELRALDAEFGVAHAAKETAWREWLAARESGDAAAVIAAHERAEVAELAADAARARTKEVLVEADVTAPTKDSDYVFITFVLNYLPHGVIGLLIAVILCAALSSTASELNALGSTTTVDFYKHIWQPGADDEHAVRASKGFTMAWGVIAIGFALFANLAENLIEAVNIIGSIFYGTVLGIFLVAFFLKRVGGTAVFWAAVIAQTLVIVGKLSLSISYLWYNLIGCAMCVVLAVVLQAVVGGKARTA